MLTLKHVELPLWRLQRGRHLGFGYGLPKHGPRSKAPAALSILSELPTVSYMTPCLQLLSLNAY